MRLIRFPRMLEPTTWGAEFGTSRARRSAARFGMDVSAEVKTDISPREVAAFWCTVRGLPYRTISWY